MRISELANASGVPSSTLRYYEAEGLLPSDRSANNYRDYGPEALERLTFIGQAKHLGLPLSDVRELVDAWASEPCASVRATYRPMLTSRAEEVDRRVHELGDLRTLLAEAIARLDRLPDRDAPCDAACAFLDRAAVEPPTACSLDAADHADRLDAWHALLDGAPRRPVRGGVAVTLPTERVAEAARLSADEQACCAFLAISLTLDGRTFTLTITAPSTGQALLADLLPTRGTE